jgi:excisionase family DNA binding protein
LTETPASAIAFRTRTIAAFEVIFAMSQVAAPAPLTDARFEAAFSAGALITAKAAAALLGLDEKTLTALVLRGSIRAVSVGKHKRFTEADLRAFLATSLQPESTRESHVHYRPISQVASVTRRLK